MRSVAFIAAALAAASASAQLGAGGSTIIESVTGVHTNFSWVKDVVTETADGALMDMQGVLATVADTEAETYTSERLGRIAGAWSKGFSEGAEALSATLSNVPRTGRFVELRFPVLPQTSRPFDIYVASNHYDSASNEDTLYVYFGQSFTNAPKLTVPYVWESGMTTQRVNGTWNKSGTTDHWTNTYDVAVERRSTAAVHYPCHRLHVKRPTALRGVPLNLDPHGVWGGPDGVAFGSTMLTVTMDVDGLYTTYTGPVTNSEAGVVAWFDNGAFMGTTQIENEE